MNYLKQSTAATIVLGPFVDSTDGFTAETALTISQADVRLSKNGGAFAQANESSAASHMENGYYSKALDATDTNSLGRLLVAVNESGALPVWREYTVLAANVYDSLVGGGDLLQIDVTGLSTLDADGVRDAVGLASANLDTQLAGLDAGIDALPGSSSIADAVHDEAVEGVVTLRQLLRLCAAALGGKVSGMESNAPVFRDIGDTKNRITATCDADGNRTGVTLDLT